ncbi:Putative General alpha-glucoside permease [[Torrubiella] hemipterigena]|uniref:Putative General alpha-glucoside permease n=1 Tax=[Torrubiella] hemipterigena TaxID=1531966 RepID=A0A0A1TIK3_9HYPO|nr:Putative General alpha-glucoside permease [[Torrubiella] hemipterigena]
MTTKEEYYTADSESPRKASLVDTARKEDLLSEAVAGTQAEHALGFWKSLKLYRTACLWSVFLSTCIIMEGFDITLINSLYAYEPFNKKFGELHFDAEHPDGFYTLTAAWQAGLSNGAYCGEIIGLFLAGIIADRFGYRKTLICALGLSCAFIFIIFFSQSLPQLLIGELLIGIPWGAFQTLTTTYAAEVCPLHLRAYLTTYVNLCWVIGQLLSSGVLVAMLARDDEWGFRIPFALQWMWPVPLMIGIYLAPESPWWLVRKGRIEEAKHSLLRLTTRNSGLEFKPDETIAMIVHTNEMERELQAGMTYWDLFKGTNLRRTEIVCAVWSVQAVCGASFMGYSTYFYKKVGLDDHGAFSMSLGQYGLGAVGTLLSWSLMGRFGRRTLYLYGQALLCILLLIIGFASLAGRSNIASQWAIGSMLLVFTFIYDSTVGPVCYSLVAELSSTRLRTKTVVLARNVYNMLSIITNIITPNMLNETAWNWGAKAAFLWAGTCFLCTTWTFFRLPEPKGRTYGELDILFEHGVSARKFASTEVHSLQGNEHSVSAVEKVESEQVEHVVKN